MISTPPIVISARRGLKDMIREGENDLLVPTALASGHQTAIDRPLRLARMRTKLDISKIVAALCAA